MVGNRFIRRMMRSMRNSSHAFTVSDKNLLVKMYILYQRLVPINLKPNTKHPAARR